MPGVNHPAWILGHLAFSADMIAGRLGGEKFLPAELGRTVQARAHRPARHPRAIIRSKCGITQGRSTSRSRELAIWRPPAIGRDFVHSNAPSAVLRRACWTLTRNHGVNPYRPPWRPLGPALHVAAHDWAGADVLTRSKKGVALEENCDLSGTTLSFQRRAW